MDLLVVQLSSPVLLLGDFNGHHTLWGCLNVDSKGQEIADFSLSSNACTLNDLIHMYIYLATGCKSAVALLGALFGL